MTRDVARLVKDAAAGDETAWTMLVARFSGLVWSVVHSHGLDGYDAAEVFQTTWLRLAERIAHIEQPERVGSWLATTARRETQHVVRTRYRAMPTSDPRLLEPAPDPRSPEQEVVDAEQRAADQARLRRLDNAFQRLPERCRRLLGVLMASPPPGYAEVAAALDIPIGSIGPTRARCLRTLRGLLGETG